MHYTYGMKSCPLDAYSCLCTRIRHASAGAVPQWGHAPRIIVLANMGSAYTMDLFSS